MFLVLPFEWEKNGIGDFKKFDLSEGFVAQIGV